MAARRMSLEAGGGDGGAVSTSRGAGRGELAEACVGSISTLARQTHRTAVGVIVWRSKTKHTCVGEALVLCSRVGETLESMSTPAAESCIDHRRPASGSTIYDVNVLPSRACQAFLRSTDGGSVWVHGFRQLLRWFGIML